MVYLLYDLLLLVSALFLIPFGLIKGLRYGHLWRGLGERLALYHPERLKILQGRKVIWVHAVSVGETRASIPLLRKLRTSFPDAAIVLSSMTFTGRSTADEIEEADLCIFLPYDLSWVVNRALNLINPDITLLVETEIWPNFIRKLAEQEVPLVLVNGRISDRSFPKYWLVRTLLSPLLKMFTHLCMQSRQDELRIIRLGADSERVSITGNLKFDLPTPDFSEQELTEFRSKLSLPEGVPVWVAGSTRQGEEEIILDAYRTLLDQGVDLVLIIVPRYPKRSKVVCELIRERQFSCELKSNVISGSAMFSSGDILVGDTLGEMLKFYACADVVFVGGSLVPIGGHNILEASLMQKPVLFGPYMQNFKVISRLLLDAGGGVQAGPDQLVDELTVLLKDPVLRQNMGTQGSALFVEHSGATDRTVARVKQIMEVE